MKETMKRIIATLLAFCLLVVGAKFWRYILIRDDTSYTRIMMHQLYTTEENINVLFVGSSHVYRALIPSITDQGFNAYTFNAGSSGQHMDGSLAVIKEAAKGNDLKQVYLEMYFGVASGMPYKDRTELTSTYILSDYMPLSFNKIQYLMHASSKEHWINSFLIARRNWKDFFDSNYVKEVITSKQTEQYRNYQFPKSDDVVQYYVDRGFVAYDEEVSADTFFNAKGYGKIPLGTSIKRDSDWYQSVSDIVDFCNQKEIELIFFVAPQPEWTLVGKGNYQEYHDFIMDISTEKNVDFIDFNLCRNEYFNTNDRSLFMDEGHLNTNGAEKFSILFADMFNGRLAIEDSLYDSFNDKITDEDIPFYGIAGPYTNEYGDRYCNIISGSNHFEYQVIETKEDGAGVILKALDDSKEFVIPADDIGILSVVCRDMNNGEISTIEVGF